MYMYVNEDMKVNGEYPETLVMDGLQWERVDYRITALYRIDEQWLRGKLAELEAQSTRIRELERSLLNTRASIQEVVKNLEHAPVESEAVLKQPRYAIEVFNTSHAILLSAYEDMPVLAESEADNG